MEGEFSAGLTIQGGDHDYSVRHGLFLPHLEALFMTHFVCQGEDLSHTVENMNVEPSVWALIFPG